MKRRLGPLLENMGEATAACVVAMVQGNLFAITATHWAIAARTGVLAGAAAVVALAFIKTPTRWRVALVLGFVTAVVDYLVHPGSLGPWITEAVVTGFGAAALSLTIGRLLSAPSATKA